MSLYIGASSSTVDFIAGADQLQALVKEIADRYLKPMIGEIKFVPKYSSSIQGLTTSGSYRIPDDTFKGWVWADGGMFRAQDFPSAWGIYKTTSTSEFAIPLVDGFVKGASTGNASYGVKNSLVKHNHPVSYNGSIGQSITIKDGLAFGSASSNSDGNPVKTTVGDVSNVTIPLFHNGKESGGYYPLPLDVSVKLSDYKLFFGDAATDYQESSPNVFSPASQRMAAMIYIGKKGE